MYARILLIGAIVLAIIIKSISNHIKNKKRKLKKKIFSTKDLVIVLLNVGFIIGGVVTLLIGMGCSDLLFPSEIKMAQPLINIIAGILFIWFGIKFLFWEDLD